MWLGIKNDKSDTGLKTQTQDTPVAYWLLAQFWLDKYHTSIPSSDNMAILIVKNEKSYIAQESKYLKLI